MIYSVDVDFVMAKDIEVEANSESEAMEKVRKMINENPYNHARGFSHYIKCEIIKANEMEEES